MAHHKSALKRIRQSRKRRLYNRFNKKVIREAIKDVRQATSFEQASELFKKATSVLDRISARGVVNKNYASHRKSQLASFVNKLKPQVTA